MIQTASNKGLRSTLGMHYTSIENIMKVIRPLFLDKLKDEIDSILSSSVKQSTKIDNLNHLLARIGKMKFFDPACGSGNFLIIAYKELRRIEIEIYEEIEKLDNWMLFYDPIVSLSQFYGIEIDEFAHEVAMLSLWISDHQMNTELNKKIPTASRKTLPLQKIGGITCANALRIDWNEVCPKSKNDEVFIFGNPPYLGSSLQNNEHKSNLDNIFADIEGYRKLDYISAWFYLGSKYIKDSNTLLAFVSTNSITQGEQVAYLWKPVLKYAEIAFAYTSFKWSNDAAHNAGVTVVIIGLKSLNSNFDKTIFTDNNKIKAKNINPYLANADNIIVKNFADTISNLPKIYLGNTPNDDGNLLIEYGELEMFLPYKKFIKQFYGAKEFLQNIRRYCLWIDDENRDEAYKIPIIKERIDKIASYRTKSKRATTLRFADKPYKFTEIRHRQIAEEAYSIIIPCHSSENRLYVPMGIVSNDTIVSNAAMVIYDAPIWLLGVLMSRMHMVWLRAIGGRLKTDYRYSASLVYNTFVVPQISDEMKDELETQVGEILDKRDYLGGSLAELYGSPLAANNPKPMNAELLNLHKRLDRLVDSVYQRTEFRNDEERLSLLLNLYQRRIRELENE